MKRNLVLIIMLIPLFSFSQLTNGDFENIETVNVPGSSDTYDKPVNWSFGDHNPYGSEITTDSYNGNYAVKLWSWYFMQSNEMLFYGNNSSDGFPISNRPYKLKGYYKFTNPNIQPSGVPDSVYVKILLTKYNLTSNERDTISLTEYNLGEQNTYSPFEINLNYSNNQVPDTIRIMFRTSYFQGPSDNTSECNYLYLDNLSLDYTMSISEFENNVSIIYPNPANNYIAIETDKKIKDIILYSTQGELIKSKTKINSTNRIDFNIENIQSGIYFIQLIGKDKKILKVEKIIIQ